LARTSSSIFRRWRKLAIVPSLRARRSASTKSRTEGRRRQKICDSVTSAGKSATRLVHRRATCPASASACPNATAVGYCAEVLVRGLEKSRRCGRRPVWREPRRDSFRPGIASLAYSALLFSGQLEPKALALRSKTGRSARVGESHYSSCGTARSPAPDRPSGHGGVLRLRRVALWKLPSPMRSVGSGLSFSLWSPLVQMPREAGVASRLAFVRGSAEGLIEQSRQKEKDYRSGTDNRPRH